MSHQTRISLLAVVLCVVGSIVASDAGMAYALHWPLSEPNTKGAIFNGIVLGMCGAGITIYTALWVRPSYAIWFVAMGGFLNTIISGIANFLQAAWSAAC
jgi:hypothetical protein